MTEHFWKSCMSSKTWQLLPHYFSIRFTSHNEKISFAASKFFVAY